ncbi:glycosyltransferase [Siculibacillus lacustris]|uniref:Glycosyltransferase n=1 Tax=Siculibacillus lacustris TaxID=1549641 RepID=A0A4Q9VJF0_9HYPH|nr:WecB/TagA/CpsF family glycosyltransferase [Siculibacillus lacustris]TBW34529.1 glycosyltransferase [Siculibacillus lacustris]
MNVPSENYLIDHLIEDAGNGRGGMVFTINLDHFSQLRVDPDFRAAYECADYVTADGMPVVLMARAEGAHIDRVTGADLVVPLSRAAADAGFPVFFFGTSDAVLERAIAELRRKIPNLVVAGSESPPMGFDPHGEAARDAARRIAASGARFCFIALGAPKQELFARTAVATVEGTFFLGIGAALDFIAGTRRRAPRFLQSMCLEWFWRLAQEPRRLTPRYLRSFRWLLGYLTRGVLGLPNQPQNGSSRDVRIVVREGRGVSPTRLG